MKTETSDFSHKQTDSGQYRAYGDSRQTYTITAPLNADPQAVWDYCQTVYPVKNRDDRGNQHQGSCGFPFALSAFGGLWHIGDGQWKYNVVFPYTD